MYREMYLWLRVKITYILRGIREFKLRRHSKD